MTHCFIIHNLRLTVVAILELNSGLPQNLLDVLDTLAPFFLLFFSLHDHAEKFSVVFLVFLELTLLDFSVVKMLMTDMLHPADYVF